MFMGSIFLSFSFHCMGLKNFPVLVFLQHPTLIFTFYLPPEIPHTPGKSNQIKKNNSKKTKAMIRQEEEEEEAQ